MLNGDRRDGTAHITKKMPSSSNQRNGKNLEGYLSRTHVHNHHAHSPNRSLHREDAIRPFPCSEPERERCLTYTIYKSPSAVPAQSIENLTQARPLALLSFPGLFLSPAFIFFTENPLISALLSASPLLPNLFLPPNPYFSSFFLRFVLPASRPPAPGLPSRFRASRSFFSVTVESSSSTSKRSGSWVEVGSSSPRSGGMSC